MKEWVVEVYVEDKRRKSGKRLLGRQEMISPTEPTGCEQVDIGTEMLKRIREHRFLKSTPFTTKVFPKMITRKNLMTGKMFEEPYDTPYYMSPAFETYWSS